MLVSRYHVSVAILLAVVFAAHSSAQNRVQSWGVSGGVTPKWSVPAYQKILFDADSVNLAGSEFRVGMVRGNILEGEWGISLVRRRLSDRADAVRKSDDGVVYSTTDTSLTGVEFHKFSPFVTVRDRVQIGIAFGGGVGSFKGSVRKLTPTAAPQVVPAKNMFSFGSTVLPVVPLFRVELAGAIIVTPHLKVRIGGGVNLPGQQLLSFTGVYLF